ncbi:hypothetical protein SRHO_G00107120 [Serrasalmus rhombeus]
MIEDVAYETVGVNYDLAFNAPDDEADALWNSLQINQKIKMTITCITVQALLHFLCSEGILTVETVVKYSRVSLDWNGHILYTIISVYSYGTTINMMRSSFLRLVVLYEKTALHNALPAPLEKPSYLHRYHNEVLFNYRWCGDSLLYHVDLKGSIAKKQCWRPAGNILDPEFMWDFDISTIPPLI